MSQENVEILKRLSEAFNEVGMAEAMRRFFAADGVFEEPPEQPSPTVAEGRDAAVRAFAHFEDAWEEHRSEPEEFRAIDEERVLALSIERFKGRDGLEIAQPCGTLYTLRDGKITRMQSFWDRENAFTAAGLRE